MKNSQELQPTLHSEIEKERDETVKIEIHDLEKYAEKPKINE